MSRIVAAVCLIVVSCLLAGCAGLAADPAEDARLWQGTWTLVSVTSNGATQAADMQWVVDGDHYNIRLNGQLHADPYRITLDAAHKRVDLFHHETPKGTYGGSAKGIDAIHPDSLTVCYDLTGREYPRSFDAGPGSRRAVYTFRRVR